MLLGDSRGFSLYDLPAPSAMADAAAVSVKPIWSHTFKTNSVEHSGGGAPIFWPAVGDTISATRAVGPGEDLHYTLSPSPGLAALSVVTMKLSLPTVPRRPRHIPQRLGTTHGVWLQSFFGDEFLVLGTRLLSEKPVDFGVVKLPLVEAGWCVRSVSFDEISGRICVLFCSKGGVTDVRMIDVM